MSKHKYGVGRADDSTNGSAPAAEPRSLVKFRHQQGFAAEGGQSGSKLSQALMRKKEAREVKPVYHPQCELGIPCRGIYN